MTNKINAKALLINAEPFVVNLKRIVLKLIIKSSIIKFEIWNLESGVFIYAQGKQFQSFYSRSEAYH